MELSLRLAVDPVAASRPRFARRGNFTSTYYAGRYREFLQKSGPVALEAALRVPVFFTNEEPLPFTGPVRIRASFHVAKPKTTKLDFPRPDIDNYAKACLDLLQQGGVLEDDNQVVELLVSKEWEDKQPHIQVVIQAL